MASPASSLSCSALRAHDALVLEHLPLADSIASAAARRLFPLVEREDLIKVAREALVRSPHPDAERAGRQRLCASNVAPPISGVNLFPPPPPADAPQALRPGPDG
jgi:hypothetical protein